MQAGTPDPDAVAEGGLRRALARVPAQPSRGPCAQGAGVRTRRTGAARRSSGRRSSSPGLPHAGQVGAYEGAGYETKGLYRSEADCIMFSRDPVGFCRVCRRAIERVIDLVAKP